MQLYLPVEPSDVDFLNCLIQSVPVINKLMSNIFLKLNADKTKRDLLSSKMGFLVTQVKTEVISFGIAINTNLNFGSHLKTFFHLHC